MFVVPAATPQPIIAKLARELSEVTASPDVRKRPTEMGVVMTPLAAKEFGDFIRADIAAWADFVAAAKIKVD